MPAYSVKEWSTVEDIISFILKNYHLPLKKNILDINEMIYKLGVDYGNKHSVILRVVELFKQFKAQLDHHINEEETVIFPAIIKFERELNIGTLKDDFICDLVERNDKMVNEHKEFHSYLESILELLNSYNLDEDKMKWLKVLKWKLKDFLHELIKHAWLEDTVLFAETSWLRDRLKSKLKN